MDSSGSENNRIVKSFSLHSSRVLLGGELSDATVLVLNGKIHRIEAGLFRDADFPLIDCGNDVIMPGLIDAHVHINEPGRTEWEGFDTATRSAARGGITTLVDMPLNSSPVSTNRAALEEKLNAARSGIHVNCGFWGGLVPGNIDDLDALLDSGVWGIKAFLTHSGIDDFPNVTEEDLRLALPIIKKHNSVLLAHCELDAPHPGIQALAENPGSYAAYLASRPTKWEDDAIDLMIRLCEEYDVRIHIVHLSSAQALPAIRNARKKGLKLSVETCTHYLFFQAEDIPDRATQFKCAPPIREKANNDQLWNALREGDIDFVITDHSPAPPDLKELESGDFSKAWGGIAGLQFSLPAFWTEARKRGFTIEDVARFMSTNVARFLRMENKGELKPGFDADITVWNPEETFSVNTADIQHRHKVTPYQGLNLAGVVKRTYVNGNLVSEGQSFPALSKGTLLFHHT